MCLKDTRLESSTSREESWAQEVLQKRGNRRRSNRRRYLDFPFARISNSPTDFFRMSVKVNCELYARYENINRGLYWRTRFMTGTSITERERTSLMIRVSSRDWSRSKPSTTKANHSHPGGRK